MKAVFGHSLFQTFLLVRLMYSYDPKLMNIQTPIYIIIHTTQNWGRIHMALMCTIFNLNLTVIANCDLGCNISVDLFYATAVRVTRSTY